jgi:hypothetical protein
MSCYWLAALAAVARVAEVRVLRGDRKAVLPSILPNGQVGLASQPHVPHVGRSRIGGLYKPHQMGLKFSSKRSFTPPVGDRAGAPARRRKPMRRGCVLA